MMEKQSLSNWEECSVSQGSWKLKLFNGKTFSLGVEAWINFFALNNFFALGPQFPHLQGKVVRIHNNYNLLKIFYLKRFLCFSNFPKQKDLEEKPLYLNIHWSIELYHILLHF